MNPLYTPKPVRASSDDAHQHASTTSKTTDPGAVAGAFQRARSAARTSGKAVGEGLLVSNTKSDSAPGGFSTTSDPLPIGGIESTDPETGEIIRFVRRGTGYVEVRQKKTPKQLRAIKFERLATIRTVLGPSHRTSKCVWCTYTKNGAIDVVKDLKTSSARYLGLISCSSLWTCSVCSAKINTRRAEELKSALEQAKALGLQCAMLTATIPHVKKDDLKALLAMMRKAWRSFSCDRAALKLRQQLQLVGTVRNVEVTLGKWNGWHPHFHCLLIYRGECLSNPQFLELSNRWGEYWQHCCEKSGLRRPSEEHGLQIQNGDFAADYIAKYGVEPKSKWRAEHEMTMTMAKTAKKESRVPFDLIDEYSAGINQAQNALLFQEFAAATKGIRQLVYSAGLKKLLQVPEKTDEEIVAEEENRPAELIIRLTWVQFKLIRRALLVKILEMAEECPEQIGPLLEFYESEYRKKYGTHKLDEDQILTNI